MEKLINEYTFANFLEAFQNAVLEGYRLDLDSNRLYPQKFGSHLYVGLVKADEVEVPAETPVESPVVASQEAASEVAEVPTEEVPEEVPVVTPDAPVVTPVGTRKGKSRG